MIEDGTPPVFSNGTVPFIDERSASVSRPSADDERYVRLHKWLRGVGLGPRTADRAIARFGFEARKRIEADPYCLLGIERAGFKLVDEIARTKFDVAPTDPRRAAAVAYALLDEQEDAGHTWTHAAQFTDSPTDWSMWRRAAEFGVEPSVVTAGLVRLLGEEDPRVVLDGQCVALTGTRDSEQNIADRVAALLAAPARTLTIPPDVWGTFTPSEEQVAALAVLASAPVVVLTGPPGSGKTTVTRAVVRMLRHSGLKVVLTAPTGKAAIRLSELAAFPAATLHRALWPVSDLHECTEKCVHVSDATAVLVDESSMLSTDLSSWLFSIVRPGSRVVLIGDVDQLPPIRAGCVFRDLIDSGVVPVVRLSRIYRQAAESYIPYAAREVNAGRVPSWWEGDVRFLETANDEQTAATIVHAVTASVPEAYGVPPEAIQVLTPQKTKACGTYELNVGLQAAARATRGVGRNGAASRGGDESIRIGRDRANAPAPGGGRGRGGFGFDVAPGDRVIHTQNDYGLQVMNGEMGTVVAASFRGLEKREGAFWSPTDEHAARVLEVDYGDRVVAYTRTEAYDLQLGYAITCHKCVAPETLIESEDGVLPISELPNTGVVGAPNGAQPFTNHVKRPSGPMIRIEAQGGYSVTVSRDHGLDVWTGTEYTRRPAEELTVGDILRLKLTAVVDPDGPPSLPTLSGNLDARAVQYRAPAKLTYDLAELLGLLVADGTIIATSGTVRLAKRHEDVVERTHDLLVSVFGLNPRRIDDQIHAEAFAVEAHSVQIVRWLVDLGGLSPNDKYIPDCIMRAPLEYQARFLRGLFEDGTVNIPACGKLDHVEWSNCKETVARTVQILLLRFGIISSLAHKTAKRKHDTWVIYIYGVNAKRFEKKIGFVSSWKNERLKAPVGRESRYWIPVSLTERKALIDRLGDDLRGHERQSMTEGRLSRSMAADISARVGSYAPFDERLTWHHVRITGMVPMRGPSECLDVPNGHRFLQNGFSGWNSQGSGWPVVVLVSDAAHWYMLSRPLTYTGVSRAESLVVIVGQMRALKHAVKTDKDAGRRTTLKERLVLAVTNTARPPDGESPQ